MLNSNCFISCKRSIIDFICYNISSKDLIFSNEILFIISLLVDLDYDILGLFRKLYFKYYLFSVSKLFGHNSTSEWYFSSFFAFKIKARISPVVFRIPLKICVFFKKGLTLVYLIRLHFTNTIFLLVKMNHN